MGSKMKKYLPFIILGTVCFVIILLVTILPFIYHGAGSSKSAIYLEYRYAEEQFGSELYSEVDYKCSDYEAEVGNIIVDRLLEIGNYSGPAEDADIDTAGALKKFYYFSRKEAVRQTFSAEFVTCKLTGDAGHVWVVYSRHGYDDHGDLVFGSSTILTLIYIKKQGDEWIVLNSRETL